MSEVKDFCKQPRVVHTGMGWGVRINGTDVFEGLNQYGCKTMRTFDIVRGLSSEEEAKAYLAKWLIEQLPEYDAQRLRADTAEAERDQAKEERDSYQRVGIAAEERNAKLLAASKGALEVFVSMIRNNCCGLHYPSVAAAAYQLRAALNPNPEAESHE